MLLLLATLVVGVVGVQLVGAVVAISLAAIAFVAPTPTLHAAGSRQDMVSTTAL